MSNFDIAIDFVSLVMLLIMVFLMGLFIGYGCASPVEKKEPEIQVVDHNSDASWFAAIRQVESGGNDNAIGDDGKSIGPYQISKAYWKDSELSGNWKQCYDPSYAAYVMTRYFKRYEPSAWQHRDWQTLCKLHNAGPNWRNKPLTTEKYWQKVKAKHEEGINAALAR